MSLHTRAENPKYDSTEWDELMKQYGNRERTNRDLLAEDEAEIQARLAETILEEADKRDRAVEAALGETDADALEFETEEDERFFEEYKAKRLEELRQGAKARSYSGVMDIAADSFRQEVTDAANDETFVVVHLYRDGRGGLLSRGPVAAGAGEEQGQTKFTRIFYSNAIPNYPEANLPTVIVYHKHDIVWNMVTMGGLGEEVLAQSDGGKALFLKKLSDLGAIKGRLP
eukprot:CAMPEP_0206270030 /NCGR_PEP_ID=MMETSP0047_2-20121206/32647_1 /ASSEMBLY_ACC=CAM_ASM_000192 /TAXON_ID=195065 /ORGANISM="Chroomonas mesostigmatica_cf, Strain CCMP1168" /LENGTH=228 /DNA_ID=CAMNT_0053698637 /DNA_START=24 /DNA_END=708 /DNA_ORIENTATION=-